MDLNEFLAADNVHFGLIDYFAPYASTKSVSPSSTHRIHIGCPKSGQADKVVAFRPAGSRFEPYHHRSIALLTAALYLKIMYSVNSLIKEAKR